MNAPTITPELLQALGIDPATIRDQVIDAIVTRAMGGYIKGSDYDDDEGYAHPSQLAKHVHAHVDKVAAARFAEVIGPITVDMIEKIEFPSTNQYGERRGETLTLREHIAKRAETYLSEQVDGYGKARWEGGNGGSHPRIVHLIHEHLKYSISGAIEKMLAEANAQIAGGIQAQVKASLDDILAKLKVTVSR
jgi:hypothetical protein